MLLKARHFAALFFLAMGAQAQDLSTPDLPEKRNHVFFHPIITGLTLAVPQAPLMLALTYERNLATRATSLIYQPQLSVGGYESGDIEVSQFSVANLLGLRKYFNGTYAGFYMQGSGALALGTASAKQSDTDEDASATIWGIGALGYLGYRWAHVYTDFGLGVQAANGTLEINDEEVDVSATGLLIDINVGFGF